MLLESIIDKNTSECLGIRLFKFIYFFDLNCFVKNINHDEDIMNWTLIDT